MSKGSMSCVSVPIADVIYKLQQRCDFLVIASVSTSLKCVVSYETVRKSVVVVSSD